VRRPLNARRDPHVVGLSELPADPRDATCAARLAHEALRMPLLRERVKSWAMRDPEAALKAADVLHAPVNDYRRYWNDTHVASAGRHRVGRASAGGTRPSAPDSGAPAASPGLAAGTQSGLR